MGRKLGSAKPPAHPMGTPFQDYGMVTHFQKTTDRVIRPKPNVPKPKSGKVF
jgi:hypothetical protein